jgi:hypothetical protein
MDRRRRTLLVLAGTALLFSALAGVAIWRRGAEGSHSFTPSLFLPGFAAHANDAVRMEIKGHDASFVAVKTASGWVLADRGNYPVNEEEARQTLITLGQLTTIAPKTARADWLHYVALDDPPKGTGSDIRVLDASGTVLAHLVFGNVEDLGGSAGSAVFVRRPGETQSWLASAVFPLHGDIASWMQKNLFDVGPGRLQQVVVKPADGPGYTVGHMVPAEPVHVIEPAVNSREGSEPDPQVINELGFAVASFAIADVRPAAGMDFSAATRVSARTFDGLAVNFELVRRDGGIWARISATPAPKAPEAVAQEAAGINARTAGWAFRLPPEKGEVMLTSLKRLMTPTAPKQGQIAMPGVRPPGP